MLDRECVSWTTEEEVNLVVAVMGDYEPPMSKRHKKANETRRAWDIASSSRKLLIAFAKY